MLEGFKTYEMQYPYDPSLKHHDGSVHNLKVKRLFSFDIEDRVYYILSYTDVSLGNKEMVALLNSDFVKVPLKEYRKFTTYVKEHPYTIESLSMLPNKIDTLNEYYDFEDIVAGITIDNSDKEEIEIYYDDERNHYITPEVASKIKVVGEEVDGLLPIATSKAAELKDEYKVKFISKKVLDRKKTIEESKEKSEGKAFITVHTFKDGFYLDNATAGLLGYETKGLYYKLTKDEFEKASENYNINLKKLPFYAVPALGISNIVSNNSLERGIATIYIHKGEHYIDKATAKELGYVTEDAFFKIDNEQRIHIAETMSVAYKQLPIYALPKIASRKINLGKEKDYPDTAEEERTIIYTYKGEHYIDKYSANKLGFETKDAYLKITLDHIEYIKGKSSIAFMQMPAYIIPILGASNYVKKYEEERAEKKAKKEEERRQQEEAEHQEELLTRREHNIYKMPEDIQGDLSKFRYFVKRNEAYAHAKEYYKLCEYDGYVEIEDYKAYKEYIRTISFGEIKLGLNNYVLDRTRSMEEIVRIRREVKSLTEPAGIPSIKDDANLSEMISVLEMIGNKELLDRCIKLREMADGAKFIDSKELSKEESKQKNM